MFTPNLCTKCRQAANEELISNAVLYEVMLMEDAVKIEKKYLVFDSQLTMHNLLYYYFKNKSFGSAIDSIEFWISYVQSINRNK